MRGSIYGVEQDGNLFETVEQFYHSEDLLQTYLAQYPNLLAGDQIDPDDPKRWIFITREAGIPGEAAGADRWSLDHLFLDQKGVPTLVEVKRSTDTRIRREVVGQLIDYAAHIVKYWDVPRIQAYYEANCAARKVSATETLAGILGDTSKIPDFWSAVEVNLRLGRLRLLFVADTIPAELRSVIEFLNQQMNPAEVLGIEIPQFVSGTLKMFAPRVVGQSEQVKLRKSPSGAASPWTEERFFEALAHNASAVEVDVAKRLADWIKANVPPLRFGGGSSEGSIMAIDVTSPKNALFLVWTYARLELPFQYYANTHQFKGLAIREEFRTRLNAVPGISLPSDAVNRRPSLPLASLTDKKTLSDFLGVMRWVLSIMWAG